MAIITFEDLRPATEMLVSDLSDTELGVTGGTSVIGVDLDDTLEDGILNHSINPHVNVSPNVNVGGSGCGCRRGCH